MMIGAEIIKTALRLIALQPLKMHYFWGKCISWIVRVLMRYRRDVVMINVSRSFPEKKYDELRRIADGFYDHFGRFRGPSSGNRFDYDETPAAVLLLH